jgi:hypothetical protein
MKSTFAIVIISWSVLCGILAIGALPQIQSHFSEQHQYFIWLRSPEKLTGSEEDLKAQDIRGGGQTEHIRYRTVF